VSDLVELAQRYITLSNEIEGVRDAMRRLLLNGAEGPKENPIQPPVRRAGGSKPNRVTTQAEAENEVVALLKDQPGMTTARISEAMNCPATSTIARLNRLKEKGVVVGGGNEGYRVAEA
jgi:hypothetical protein